MNKNGLWWCVWAALLAVTVGYVALTFFMSLIGDDIFFHSFFNDYKATWKGIPILMKTFRDLYHPRTADMALSAIWGMTPLPVMALLNGLGTGGMCGAIVLAAIKKPRSALAAMAVIALTIFTLRWDSLWMEMCTQCDCVWSAAAGIFALLIIGRGNFSEEKSWQWLLLPILLLAGAAHEAQGVAIFFGVSIWLIAARPLRHASASRIAMIVALLVGALLPFSADSLYERAAREINREPIWLITCESGYYVIALAVACAWCAVRHPKILRKLAKSQWIIWATGALAGYGVMIYAGYGGRPGWHAEIFALIALVQLLREIIPVPPAKVATGIVITLSVVVIVHIAQLVWWQKRLYNETQDVIALCTASNDGVVIYDYTPDSDLPATLMRKVHGVPDNDDKYYLHTIAASYGKENVNNLVILPTEAEKIDFTNFTGKKQIGRSMITSSLLPASGDATIYSDFPVILAECDDQIYSETKFEKEGRTFYLYAPYDDDYGAR